MNETDNPIEGVRTFGHLDFDQVRVHDAVGQYLSDQLRRDEDMKGDLKDAIDSEDRAVFFTFVWHPGVEDTFLRVFVQDKPLAENDIILEEENETETESTG